MKKTSHPLRLFDFGISIMIHLSDALVALYHLSLAADKDNV